jgi:hypothetical protein
MLLIFFAITWCVLAESPSQLLLLAVAILLRVLYVTGKRPTISRDVILFWLLIAILGYFLAPTQSKGQVLMWVCKLTLLAPLILHVGHQTASSGVVQRIPFLQSIALFFSRYLVLGRREVDDMLFWSRQNLRVVSARNANRVFPIRVSIYSRLRRACFTLPEP